MNHYGDKDGLKLLSYNAVFNFVQTNRNFGKTWAFKKRAFKRALKHDKKTIWLRMFKEEVKECAATFFQSKDLCEYCGIVLYDPETKKGNVKQNGRTFYYRRNIDRGRWRWFLKIFPLGNADAIRSADDVKTDTIVFDEYSKPAEKYRFFRGSMATNLVDILFSSKREHEVKVIFLGNKESFINPFFNFFGINPPPSSYEGIRTYKNGSIAIQQINNEANQSGDYNSKLAAALDGTPYGRYIYQSEYKSSTPIKTRKTPFTAILYVQLLFNSSPLKISVLDGYFYVNQRIDINKPIYCDHVYGKYRIERVLVKRQRNLFYAFIDAISRNAVYYDSQQAKELIQPFLKWLSI